MNSPAPVHPLNPFRARIGAGPRVPSGARAPWAGSAGAEGFAAGLWSWQFSDEALDRPPQSWEYAFPFLLLKSASRRAAAAQTHTVARLETRLREVTRWSRRVIERERQMRESLTRLSGEIRRERQKAEDPAGEAGPQGPSPSRERLGELRRRVQRLRETLSALERTREQRLSPAERSGERTAPGADAGPDAPGSRAQGGESRPRGPRPSLKASRGDPGPPEADSPRRPGRQRRGALSAGGAGGMTVPAADQPLQDVRRSERRRMEDPALEEGRGVPMDGPGGTSAIGPRPLPGIMSPFLRLGLMALASETSFEAALGVRTGSRAMPSAAARRSLLAWTYGLPLTAPRTETRRAAASRGAASRQSDLTVALPLNSGDVQRLVTANLIHHHEQEGRNSPVGGQAAVLGTRSTLPWRPQSSPRASWLTAGAEGGPRTGATPPAGPERAWISQSLVWPALAIAARARSLEPVPPGRTASGDAPPGLPAQPGTSPSSPSIETWSRPHTNSHAARGPSAWMWALQILQRRIFSLTAALEADLRAPGKLGGAGAPPEPVASSPGQHMVLAGGPIWIPGRRSQPAPALQGAPGDRRNDPPAVAASYRWPVAPASDTFYPSAWSQNWTGTETGPLQRTLLTAAPVPISGPGLLQLLHGDGHPHTSASPAWPFLGPGQGRTLPLAAAWTSAPSLARPLYRLGPKPGGLTGPAASPFPQPSQVMAGPAGPAPPPAHARAWGERGQDIRLLNIDPDDPGLQLDESSQQWSLLDVEHRRLFPTPEMQVAAYGPQRYKADSQAPRSAPNSERVVEVVRREVDDRMKATQVIKRFTRSEYVKIADQVFALLKRRQRAERERVGLF